MVMRDKGGTIGVISDTHGWLRDEALDALRGSRLIVHAGDIGSVDVLTRLETIAPVVAVRGNVDLGEGWSSLPVKRILEVAGRKIAVIHILDDLMPDELDATVRCIISGHSHRPSIEHEGRLLLLNPGSAGPRRFSLPITVARLWATGDGFDAEIVPIG